MVLLVISNTNITAPAPFIYEGISGRNFSYPAVSHIYNLIYSLFKYNIFDTKSTPIVGVYVSLILVPETKQLVKDVLPVYELPSNVN